MPSLTDIKGRDDIASDNTKDKGGKKGRRRKAIGETKEDGVGNQYGNIRDNGEDDKKEAKIMLSLQAPTAQAEEKTTAAVVNSITVQSMPTEGKGNEEHQHSKSYPTSKEQIGKTTIDRNDRTRQEQHPLSSLRSLPPPSSVLKSPPLPLNNKAPSKQQNQHLLNASQPSFGSAKPFSIPVAAAKFTGTAPGSSFVTAASRKILLHSILARLSAFITLVRHGHFLINPENCWWLIQDLDKIDMPVDFDKFGAAEQNVDREGKEGEDKNEREMKEKQSTKRTNKRKNDKITKSIKNTQESVMKAKSPPVRKRRQQQHKCTPITLWDQLGFTEEHMMLAFSAEPTKPSTNRLWAESLFQMPIAFNGLRVCQHRNAIFVTVTTAPWSGHQQKHLNSREKMQPTQPSDDEVLFWGWDKANVDKLKFGLATMSMNIKGSSIEVASQEYIAQPGTIEEARENMAIAVLQRKQYVQKTKIYQKRKQNGSSTSSSEEHEDMGGQGLAKTRPKRKIIPISKELNLSLADHLKKRPYWTEDKELPVCNKRSTKSQKEDSEKETSLSSYTPSKLKPDLGAEDDLKDFPLMASLGIRLGFGVMDEQQRQNLLREMITFNKKHKQRNRFSQLGGSSRDCFLLCFTQRDEFTGCWPRHMDSIDDLLNALSTKPDKSADFLCEFLAKKRPASYVQAYPLAKEIEDKKGHWSWHTHRPEDFRMHDESDETNEADVEWNVMYTHLLNHKKEVGHCNVPFPTGSFGEWVVRCRTLKRKNDPRLTPKRIELMEEIGFEWTVSRRYLGVKGDPRMNLALVAKLQFPSLTYPEALLLGGYSRDEAYQHPGGKRDTLCRRKRQFRRGVDSKVRNEVQRLMFKLEDETNGIEQLFGRNPYYNELIVQKCDGNEAAPTALDGIPLNEKQKEQTTLKNESDNHRSDSDIDDEDRDQGAEIEQNEETMKMIGSALIVPTLSSNSVDGEMEEFQDDEAEAPNEDNETTACHSNRVDGDAKVQSSNNDAIDADSDNEDFVLTQQQKQSFFPFSGLSKAAAINPLKQISNADVIDAESDYEEFVPMQCQEHYSLPNSGFSNNMMVNHVAAAAIDSMVPFHPTHVARGTGGVSGRIYEPFSSPGGNVFIDVPTAVSVPVVGNSRIGCVATVGFGGDLFNSIGGGADRVASHHAAGSGPGGAASYLFGPGGSASPYPFRAALAAAPATAISHGGTSTVFHGGAVPMKISMQMNAAAAPLHTRPSRNAPSVPPFSEERPYLM